MPDFYSQFYPKSQTGKECKKVECERYKDYSAWKLGSDSLKFCMECKHAHTSQYKKTVLNAKLTSAVTTEREK